ncbi:MAG TPA: hypothetical protein VFG54_20795 [Prolixibacteraceae bacterium]|nr:hypothetical protein [Prolixibacteraceae bacterium]
MIGIGIRVYSNSKVYYTIIEQDGINFNYITVSNVIIPLSLNEPERLNYLRNTLIDISSEYKVNNALIRVRESVQQVDKNAIQRFYVEGVILETLASGAVNKYKLGNIASITSLLNVNTATFKQYIENTIPFPLLPSNLNWGTYSIEEKESIISCHASLNL